MTSDGPPALVDLRSDTVTRPTPAMRQAMAEAEVGDDVLGEDPTVNRLQQRVAELVGKEAALFVPSGTMANLLAILAQTRPGDTLILSAQAHPFHYESGNAAMVAGVMIRTTGGELGTLTAEDVAAQIVRGEDHHYSPTTLIAVENTTNRGGGVVFPLEDMAAIGTLARERGLRVHCDGARIFNACVAANLTAAEYARHVDTLSFCFSKSLGCPVGSILTGDAAAIDRAHRFRKMLGGGMRQAGILAAAALYALDHHIERLADDHARASRFREELEGTPGLAFPLPSPTSIVFVDVADAPRFVEALRLEGVLVGRFSGTRLRAVFHLDVDDEGVQRAIGAFRKAAAAQARKA
jgi:threonine aldolase